MGVAFVVACRSGGHPLPARLTRHFAHVHIKDKTRPVLEAHMTGLLAAETPGLGPEAAAALPQLVQASLALLDLVNAGSLHLQGGQPLRAGIHELSILARVSLHLRPMPWASCSSCVWLCGCMLDRFWLACGRTLDTY